MTYPIRKRKKFIHIWQNKKGKAFTQNLTVCIHVASRHSQQFQNFKIQNGSWGEDRKGEEKEESWDIVPLFTLSSFRISQLKAWNRNLDAQNLNYSD